MGLGTQAKQNKVSKQATQVSKQAHSKQASRQASNQPRKQTSPLIFMGGPEGVPHKNLGGGEPSKSSKLNQATDENQAKRCGTEFSWNLFENESKRARESSKVEQSKPSK